MREMGSNNARIYDIIIFSNNRYIIPKFLVKLISNSERLNI